MKAAERLRDAGQNIRLERSTWRRSASDRRGRGSTDRGPSVGSVAQTD
jgi:hypothetical protein